MIEFILSYAEPDEIKQLLKVAGVSTTTYNKWRDKKTSPTTYSCILICRAIARQYKKKYDPLILECIKSVTIYK